MGEGSIIGEKTAEKVTKKLSEKAMASVAKSFSRDSSSDSGFSTKDFLNSMKDFFDKSGQNSNSTSNTKDTGDSGEGGSEDREERKEREETREEDKEDNEEREEREKREGRDKRKRHISDLKDKFTLNKLENKKDKIETKDATQTWNTVAFIITLGVILIDLFQFGFNRNKQTIAGVLLLYGLYIIFFFLKTMFIDYEGDFGESIKNFKLPLILTILQIVIPYMALEFIPLILPKVAGLIFGILLMFSPWLVYYIFLIPPDSSGRIITFFRVAWVLFLLGLIFLMTLPILTESLTNVASTKTVNLNPTVALNDFGGAIKDQIAKMKGLLNSTKDEFTYNKKGQIDKNVNSRLGVFIEELKTIPGIITENNDFFLLGELRVNTLFNEIAITSNCYLEKNSNDKSPKTGEMDENYYLTYGKSIELIECNMSGVDAGIYKAYFKASFNFETWAYIDYTFVDKDLAMQYYREGRDINKELYIEQETFPIYTDGPAKIMMIAADQPVEVDFERRKYPKIGLSLEKNFMNGKIQKINEIIVQSPSMIKLVNCNFNGEFEALTEVPKGFEGGNLESYNYYRFYNNVSNPDSEALKTIVCNMYLSEEEYMQQKNINSKIVKTIILKADYDYEVKSQESSFLVKEDPFN